MSASDKAAIWDRWSRGESLSEIGRGGRPYQSMEPGYRGSAAVAVQQSASVHLRKPAPSMPVVVGAPRSGTTLLRFMLDAHPQVAIPPETGFLLKAPRLTGMGDALRQQFLTAVTGLADDGPWKDFGIPVAHFRSVLEGVEPFTLSDGFRAFYRTYAARFGKARWGDKTPLYCLHLRSIAAVLPEAHFVHIIRDGRDVALSLRSLWFSPGPSMEAQARQWAGCVEAARRDGAACPHYLEVRYE